MNRRLLLLVGVVLTLAGAATIGAQTLSGAQHWGPTLADNLIFAKSIPFTLGLGVVIGAVAGLAPGIGRVERRASDGAVRRFGRLSLAMHWIAAVGFLLALATGFWQYLKGILDVESPVFMPFVYRVHYIGATLLLLTMSTMVTYWLVSGVRGLLPPGGQKIRHLRGLAHELPGALGGTLAALIGLNMRRVPPPVGQFTYYETTVSFPTWIVLLGLVTLTGVLKAMRYVYPIPGDVLWWTSTIHVASMVLLAAKALDHLRYVLAPSRWALMTAMVSGWMSERVVRERHPGWREEIEGGSARPEEPVPASVAANGPVAGTSGGGA